MDADLLVLNPKGGIDDVMARGRWHVRAGTCGGDRVRSRERAA